VVKVFSKTNQDGNAPGALLGIIVLILFVGSVLILFIRGIPTIQLLFQTILTKISSIFY